MNIIVKILLSFLVWYNSFSGASNAKESSAVSDEERYKNSSRKHQAEMMLEEFKKVTTPEEIRGWALEQMKSSGDRLTRLDPEKLPHYIRQFQANDPIFFFARGDKNPPCVSITWGSGQLLYGIEVGDKDYRTDYADKKAEWVPGIYLYYMAISG